MEESRVPVWRKIVAAIADFLLVFVGAGLVIANITGETTEGGFQLQGGSALVLYAIVIAYFVIGNLIGGTVFQRVFRTRGPKRSRTP